MATSPQLMEAFKNFSKNRNNPNAPTLPSEAEINKSKNTGVPLVNYGSGWESDLKRSGFSEKEKYFASFLPDPQQLSSANANVPFADLFG